MHTHGSHAFTRRIALANHFTAVDPALAGALAAAFQPRRQRWCFVDELVGRLSAIGLDWASDDRVSSPVLRSVLVRRVLGCLRDHPHDDTAARVARRLGEVDADAVEAALVALESDGLAMQAAGHWSLTRRGWTVARLDDPPSADVE